MKAHSLDSEMVSAKEVIDMVTWNRPRTTEELLSFISGHHAKLEDVELGI